MEWHQLYSSATSEERLKVFIKMLRVIEAHEEKNIFMRGWLIFDRRRDQIAHYINDRRRNFSWRAAFNHLSIFFSLYSLTIGVVILAINLTPLRAVLLILGYEAAIVGLMYFKPRHASWSMTR